MTPEELIQQLGPGTDGAVCVQRLIDAAKGNPAKDHVVAEKHAAEVPVRVALAVDDDDEKPTHTPYRNPKK